MARSAQRSATVRSPKSTLPVHSPSGEIRVFGAQASPCTITGSSSGGRGPSSDGVRPTQLLRVHCAGKSSTGSACRARSPVAMARSASGRRACHTGPIACSPGRAAVTSHCASASLPACSTRGAGWRGEIHSSRRRSASRSMPASRGLHFTNRSPIRKVSPPSSLRHASRGSRPSANSTTTAGTPRSPRVCWLAYSARSGPSLTVGHRRRTAGWRRAGIGCSRSAGSRRPVPPGLVRRSGRTASPRWCRTGDGRPSGRG